MPIGNDISNNKRTLLPAGYRRTYLRHYQTYTALDGYKHRYRNVSDRMAVRLINRSVTHFAACCNVLRNAKG